jgi:hypothetical protein
VSIQDAARRLGVSEGAVRKRVARGTLHHDKADDGRVYVYLDAGVDAGQDAGVDANNNALISQLRSENQYLREENQRKDEIIMQQASPFPPAGRVQHGFYALLRREIATAYYRELLFPDVGE